MEMLLHNWAILRISGSWDDRLPLFICLLECLYYDTACLQNLAHKY